MNDTITIPASALPTFRAWQAFQNGTSRRIMLRTWGGIGDQICAEPTLRFALKHFKGAKIFLASELPELFSHLEFADVYDLRHRKPDYAKFLVLDTICDQDANKELSTHFFSHLLTHCVDYPALSALRLQLPVADREVRLRPGIMDQQVAVAALRPALDRGAPVAIHAGRHWQSKTFPAAWWLEVIERLASGGDIVPVLIGANADDNRGTVDLDKDRLEACGAIDLRGQLQLMETVALLQDVPMLITNDSAPLHMAASGDACIGYVATCKHPDLICHWRKGVWSRGMHNLSLGGVWDAADYSPVSMEEMNVESVDPALLAKWLPTPESVERWALDHL